MPIKVLAVVPARMESSRFPGKVIHPYRGRPLIWYLLNDIRSSRKIHQLVVATDSREIKKALADYDVEVVMTGRHHRTGTDRANEAARKVGGDIIINIQADNYGLKGTLLDRVINSSGSTFLTTIVRFLLPDAGSPIGWVGMNRSDGLLFTSNSSSSHKSTFVTLGYAALLPAVAIFGASKLGPSREAPSPN